MAAKLAKYLEEKGQKVLLTFEPGNGLLEASPEQMDYRNLSNITKAFLFAADRSEHLHKEIIPSLKEGWTVICERFVDATFAYQGHGQGMSLEFLGDINYPYILEDLSILLDVLSAEGFKRKFKVSHTFDLQDDGFQERVRKGYLEIFKDNPLLGKKVIVSTSSKSIEDVWSNVLWEVIDQLPDLCL